MKPSETARTYAARAMVDMKPDLNKRPATCVGMSLADATIVENAIGLAFDAGVVANANVFRRAILDLLKLCASRGIDHQAIDDGKELVRCARTGCGLGGACDGVGSSQYPCPLREPCCLQSVIYRAQGHAHNCPSKVST